MNDRKVAAPSLGDLQKHKSQKWREFPHEVLPLPVAEMDYPIAAPISEVLTAMIKSSDLGYLGNIPEMGPAFGGFAKRRWGWKVDPEQVRIATDVGVAVVETLRVFTKPGDRILVNSPVYQNFYTWIKESHLEKIDVPLRRNAENAWELNWEEIEKVYSSGIKVHLLCSPHNPIGKVFSKEELSRLVELAHKNRVIIISDEIHAPLTYSEKPFTPILALGPRAESIAITVTAASKGWNIAGLKCALIITQNELINEKLKELAPAMHYRASILGAFATVAAFDQSDIWLDTVLTNLDFNRRLISDLIRKNLPEIGYSVPECSYLAWLDLEKLGLGSSPTQVILEKAKVAFNDGVIYGEQSSQFARLNFATSPEIINEAFQRIAKAL